MRNNVVQNNITPQGTWNLWWCDKLNMWCDCTTSLLDFSGKCENCRMWKNSTFSNPVDHTTTPMYHNYTFDGGFQRRLPVETVCSGSGKFPNLGEIESVTCHVCSPQDPCTLPNGLVCGFCG